MMHILIAEDDPTIRSGLEFLLKGAGYQVESVANGAAAIDSYRVRKPDLLLLDVMMPKMNGYAVLTEIRRTDPLTPVIFLSAKGSGDDMVLGLSLGSDDYIAKPFDADVLLARVAAALRRSACPVSHSAEAETFVFAGLTVDTRRMVLVSPDGTSHPLTLTDLDLIRHFVKRGGEVIRRVDFSRYSPATDHTLDQRISSLRRKLGVGARCLETVYGVGYRYCGEGLVVRG